MSLSLSSNWKCSWASIILVFGILIQSSFGISRSCQAQGVIKSYGGKSYTVYQVDLSREQLEILSRGNDGTRFRNAGAIKSFAEAQGKRLVFATNAGIFGKSFVPLGLLVEKGRRLVPLNTADGQGNFYMKPNGVFYITERTGSIVGTKAFDPKMNVDYASQSGPILVDAGTINSSFDPNSRNRLVRSGVGVREQSQILFAISNEPVSFNEFAVLFKDGLRCKSALYLDGVISVMYAADLGREQISGDFAAMFAVFGEPHAN